MQGKVMNKRCFLIAFFVTLLLYSCKSTQIYIYNAEFSVQNEIQLAFLDKTTVIYPAEISEISSLAINGVEIGEREEKWFLDENGQFTGLYLNETDEIISPDGDVIYKVIRRTKNCLTLYSLRSGNEYDFYLKKKDSD